MITVVCWLWNQPEYRVKFTSQHVNTWASMVSRNLTIPHRLLCITDNPAGIDIDTYPLWDEFSNLSAPHWPKNKRPQCYRRIKAFDPDMRKVLGKRFASIDLDCVVTGCLDPILSREEDFIICESPKKRHNNYVGCMWMMDTGCRPQVYHEFGQQAVDKAKSWTGSDQAWVMQKLGRGEAVWNQDDGIYSYRNDKRNLPIDNMRIVFFNGKNNPWDEHIQKQHSWVQQHYH